jgi:phage terminase large subunit-like protein
MLPDVLESMTDEELALVRHGLLRVVVENQLAGYKPYAKQAEFHTMGAEKRERMLSAGNQLGKTLSAANEVAMHLTGRYPEWWGGKRFTKGNNWLAGSESGELTRRGVQRYLFGRDPKKDPGTGSIPKDCIVDLTWSRHVNEFIDTAKIRFVAPDGVTTTSTISLKSYDQGRGKWQADTVDGVWFDEEPPEDIYMEGLTRTNAAFGPVIVTCTLLKGMTAIAMRFWSELGKYQDAGMVNMTIHDVDHYTADQKAKIIAGYPAHERAARTLGVPSMGSGKVFPIEEDAIRVDPFPLPAHWPRIIGLDFGWDHPAGAAWLAWDRDADTVYVVNEFQLREATPVMQAPLLAAKGKWIPVAWPHDGLQHDKGSGEQLAQQYRNGGVNMLPERATHAPAEGQKEGEGGNGLEAGVSEMLERMQTGRWKVFSTCTAWLAEFRMYHRKDGLIVKLNDDVLSASRYGMMMLRFAITEPKRSTLGAGPNYSQRRAGY